MKKPANFARTTREPTYEDDYVSNRRKENNYIDAWTMLSCLLILLITILVLST